MFNVELVLYVVQMINREPFTTSCELYERVNPPKSAG